VDETTGEVTRPENPKPIEASPQVGGKVTDEQSDSPANSPDHLDSGDDEYQLAIKEVEDTQSLNTRTAKEKTYHLIISFRPEDEAFLTPEIFRQIEVEFAAALGFEEHQRHCGVHKNTDNLHLHVAYNQIHPVKRTRHEPYRDFAKRDQLCRQLELKYGLRPDNGSDPGKEAVVNDAARALQEVSQANAQSQTRLSVVLKMSEIFRQEGVKGGRYRIDGKGTVIFTLPSGGTIRDNGKEIHFSSQDDQAKAIAEKLAKLKWGNNVQIEGGVVKSKSLSYTPIQRSPSLGQSR